MKLSLIAAILVSFILSISVAEAQLTLITSRNGTGANDSVDWGTKGPSGTTLTNPFTVSSLLGYGLTVSQASGNPIIYSNSVAGGNFGASDLELWTQAGGPLTIIFPNAVSAAGAQIQANYYGSFVARLTAYDGNNNLLGSVTEDGTSNSNIGTAIFLGGSVSTNDISKIVFSLDSAPPGGNVGDFGINQLSMREAGVPEADTFSIAMIGLAGSAFLRRRRAR